jgi:hypothetical protein
MAAEYGLSPAGVGATALLDSTDEKMLREHVHMRVVIVVSFFFITTIPATPAEPVASGLEIGQRPGPYSALVSVGPQRGQMHCFICETADRPAVIVFARKTSDSLGRLVRGLDQALLDRKAADLRAWVTFLNDDQTAYDAEVIRWGRAQSVRSVPLAVFENVAGPPAYKLNRDAEVTVIVYTKQKVVRNLAFRSGELTDARVAEVLKSLDDIAPTASK